MADTPLAEDEYRVLECLNATAVGATVDEIADAIHFPVVRVRRVLGQLLSRNLLVYRGYRRVEVYGAGIFAPLALDERAQQMLPLEDTPND